jgi:hypothetical protein
VARRKIRGFCRSYKKTTTQFYPIRPKVLLYEESAWLLLAARGVAGQGCFTGRYGDDEPVMKILWGNWQPYRDFAEGEGTG